jgi:hypothetical protein
MKNFLNCTEKELGGGVQYTLREGCSALDAYGYKCCTAHARTSCITLSTDNAAWRKGMVLRKSLKVLVLDVIKKQTLAP